MQLAFNRGEYPWFLIYATANLWVTLIISFLLLGWWFLSAEARRVRVPLWDTVIFPSFTTWTMVIILVGVCVLRRTGSVSCSGIPSYSRPSLPGPWNLYYMVLYIRWYVRNRCSGNKQSLPIIQKVFRRPIPEAVWLYPPFICGWLRGLVHIPVQNQFLKSWFFIGASATLSWIKPK